MGAQGGLPASGVEQDVQARLGQAWGAQPVAGVGRNQSDIFEAARQGPVRGLFFLDYDPIAEGASEAQAVLARAPFVVVQAARTSPILQYANVVFPQTAFAETAGTFTNTEGRIQRLRASVVPSTYVREGWQVLADLGLRLGGTFGYRTAEDVTQEIARVTGLESWAGILEQAVLAPVGATR
jgi:predicted molibdopterin-dependent oxidoreductase YjgC